MKYLRPAIKIVLFFVVFCLMLICINVVSVPYWKYTDDPDDEAESPRYQDFYKLEDNTLDYLVLGRSTSYHSVDPMQVYANTGYSGYDLGSPSQPMSCTYYWLQEALKTQSPRYVFVDVSAFLKGTPENDRYLKCLLPMKPSVLKYKAAFECSPNKEVLYTVLFPLYQFHSRWKEISAMDIKRKNPDPYLLYGSTVRFVSKNSIDAERINLREEKYVSIDDDGNTVITLDPLTLNEEAVSYFEKIAALCREKNITCIPFKFPTKNWNERWSSQVQERLDNEGLKLWDLSLSEEPAGINWEKDSPDNGKHLNYFGMVKIAYCMADYLNEEHTLRDHRGKTGYESWDDDLKKYCSWENEKIRKLFYTEYEWRDFISSLVSNKDRYLIFAAAKFDISENCDEELQGCMQRLGFDSEFSDHYQESFLGISDRGKAELEVWDRDIINYEFVYRDLNGKEHSVKLRSCGVSADCTIFVDDEAVETGTGLNLVVVDRETGRMEANAYINYRNSDGICLVNDNRNKDELLPVIPDGKYTLREAGRNEGASLSVNIKRDSLGRYMLTEPGTDMVYGAYRGGNKAGDPVTAMKDAGTQCFRWRISYLPDGKYTVTSPYNDMSLLLGDSGDLSFSDVESRFFIERED